MADLLQHEQHPDADQLNAFVEKALPEHERLATLAHLAGCAECRNIVFLAQKDLLAEAPVTAEEKEPWWKAWWRPLPVAGVAVACMILLVVSVGVQRIVRNQNKPAYQARNEVTNRLSAATDSQLASSLEKPPALDNAESATAASKLPGLASSTAPAQQKRATPRASASRPVSGEVGVASGTAGGVASGVMGGILGGVGGPAPSPPANPQAATSEPSPQTNFVVRQLYPRQTTPNPATPGIGALHSSPSRPAPVGHDFAALDTVGGPLRLTVAHGEGVDNGLSALQGSIKDPAGAAIPKATITLRGLSGQANAATTSNQDGGFTLASLPAGQYEIQVASNGFLPLTQRINLQAKDLAMIDPVLPLAAAAQTVTVASDRLVLKSQPPQVAATIDKSPENSLFVSQTVLNGTLLAFDRNGILFRRGAGSKDWKKVKAKWHGAVVNLSTSQDSAPGASAAPFFLITTHSGNSEESWSSPDGRHWKRR
jgi:hypothetical protein